MERKLDNQKECIRTQNYRKYSNNWTKILGFIAFSKGLERSSKHKSPTHLFLWRRTILFLTQKNRRWRKKSNRLCSGCLVYSRQTWLFRKLLSCSCLFFLVSSSSLVRNPKTASMKTMLETTKPTARFIIIVFFRSLFDSKAYETLVWTRVPAKTAVAELSCNASFFFILRGVGLSTKQKKWKRRNTHILSTLKTSSILQKKVRPFRSLDFTDTRWSCFFGSNNCVFQDLFPSVFLFPDGYFKERKLTDRAVGELGFFLLETFVWRNKENLT